jgi:ubiquinone/menaquinone biosynthesis C-methylase UbiE
MSHRVCPWWMGYLLTCPLRRCGQDPARILSPYILPGMTVFEPGPGMGFFTLELARRVGPGGRVIVVDIEPKMLSRLHRRAVKAGLAERLECRLAQPDAMGISDLEGSVDFGLAFAMVHEMPSSASFFAQTARILKPGALLMLSEPRGHVSEAAFAKELAEAAGVGLNVIDRPQIRSSHTALLKRS